jgi:MFS family permease
LGTTNGRKQIRILSLAFFFSYFGVGAIQPYLTPYLEKTAKLPGTQCVWILASVYLFGIIARLLAALLVNRFGARATVILGLALCTAFSWLIVVTTDFGILLVGAAVWGSGAACLWVAGTPMVLNVAAEGKYGSATSVLYAAVYLGQGAGVCFLGWVADTFGKPQLFLAAACISVVANLVIVALPSQGRLAKVDQPAFSEGFRALASAQGSIVSFMLLATMFGFGILLGNLSGSVAERSFGEVGLVTLGAYIARFVCSLFAGPLSDRFGRTPLLAIAFGLCCAGLVAAGLWEHAGAKAIAAATLGVEMGVASVIVSALVGDWVPPNKRHMVLGTLFVWHGLGAALSLVLGQHLYSWLGGYQPTFIVFGAVMGLCTILSVVLGFLPKADKAFGKQSSSA